MSKLKFEGIKIGTVIRARDFEDRPEVRGSMYVEGTIESVEEYSGVKMYKIKVLKDVYDGIEEIGYKSRVGKYTYVPMEIYREDFDNRIEVL